MARRDEIGAGRNAMKQMTALRATIGMGLLALLAACAPAMRFHGYAPTEDQLAEIVVGQDTRATVAEKIGQPGVGGVIEGSGWFYVQSDWQDRQWRAPEEVDRQVVAISFDGRDRVSNIERFGLEDGQVVALTRRVTSVGPSPSVMSQVFAVLGRFSASSLAR